MRSICQAALLAVVTAFSVSACVSTTVDEMVFNEPIDGIGESTVVILGRRHASDYDTEPEFVRCVADHIRRGDKSISIIGELEFLNTVYPWFEPRTAPLRASDIVKFVDNPALTRTLEELKLEYIIWIDGSTIRSDSAGSMTCGIGPGGGGCFGFGTWSNDSNYESVIWDFTDQAEVGRVNATASGQSYMPALIVPIPIIAPVQGTACDSVGDQLLEFLSSEY